MMITYEERVFVRGGSHERGHGSELTTRRVPTGGQMDWFEGQIAYMEALNIAMNVRMFYDVLQFSDKFETKPLILHVPFLEWRWFLPFSRADDL